MYDTKRLISYYIFVTKKWKILKRIVRIKWTTWQKNVTFFILRLGMVRKRDWFFNDGIFSYKKKKNTLRIIKLFQTTRVTYRAISIRVCNLYQDISIISQRSRIENLPSNAFEFITCTYRFRHRNTVLLLNK